MLLASSLNIHSPGGYSVGWLTLSLINAGLAEAKGRSRWNWWLLSLFFGPIATFYVVIAKSRLTHDRLTD